MDANMLDKQRNRELLKKQYWQRERKKGINKIRFKFEKETFRWRGKRR